MYHEDWLMRQIELMALGIAKFLFGKDMSVVNIYEFADKTVYTGTTEKLCKTLAELLGEQKINEAENLLFDNIDTKDKTYLSVAIMFYIWLNELDDATLAANDFSRSEIYGGLNEIKEMYGIFF